jgi:hypothetical protein
MDRRKERMVRTERVTVEADREKNEQELTGKTKDFTRWEPRAKGEKMMCNPA